MRHSPGMRAQSTAITYYVVVPFGRDEEGNLVPLEAMEAPSRDAARRRAEAIAGTHAGAVAFSRTGDPDSGEFGDAVILRTFGEADKNMLGS